MDYVDGLVLRTAEDASQLTPGQARQLSERFVDMLAAIHGLDIEAAGLAGFGRPEGTWTGSWPAGSGSGSCR